MRLGAVLGDGERQDFAVAKLRLLADLASEQRDAPFFVPVVHQGV